jgi:hypothetical protein
MNRLSCTIPLLLLSLFSFAQEIVSTTPVVLKKKKEVFQIVDKDNKEVDMFVVDDQKIKVIRMDQNMQIIDSLTNIKPNKKIYGRMIGNNGSSTSPTLFWTSSDYKKIAAQQFDLNSKTVKLNELDLELANERYLQCFSLKSFFYLLTITKNSGLLKLYVFDTTGKLEIKPLDTSRFQFYGNDYVPSNLFDILKTNLLPFEAPFSLKKIESEIPISLVQSANKRKCYYNDNQITITIDTNNDFTQLIFIDLLNYKITEKTITKPKIKWEGEGIADFNSNSFLINDKLIQIKSSSDKFILTLKDLEEKLIKEYSITKDTEIGFKNTEIVQTGGDFNGTRVLEKSSQFIRKVNNLNSGISYYRIGNKSLVTLGSVSEQQQSAMAMGGMFGAAGAILAAVLTNSTMDNYDDYARRKVIKVDCLFDENLNHLPGVVPTLAFDKIRTFLAKEDDFSLKTIFRLNEYYYLGYYDEDSKNYTIRKFTDETN